MCLVADNVLIKPLISERIKQTVIKLLHRPWFQRIWVRDQIIKQHRYEFN
jgi:hypothetical protein